MKSIRKNHGRDKISHTSATLDGGINLDKVISNLSAWAFPLDDESKYVIDFLAKNGPSTEYKIGKLYAGIDRYTVRRRIY